MNPEKWESVDQIDQSNPGVMVSNLPLLFAHGMPTSVQKITLSELEVFVPFMVRCSVGEDLRTTWSQLPRPPWWPNRLPFRVPSTRNVLIKLLERCYEYHGCLYLLHFCASLDQMQQNFRFTDNRDGTVSMYHGNSGKLLVTFRNENRDYDQEVKPKNSQSSQKKLLPFPHPSGNHGAKTGIMVRPPAADVFLCDKCDDEFSSLKEVQIHERNCKGDRPPSPKLPSPEPEISDDEQDQQNQVPYLAYFGLQPERHTGFEPYQSPRKKSVFLQKKVFSQSYLKYDAVEVSSPLGKYIMSKSKCGRIQMAQQQVLRYERHIHAAPDSEYMMSTRERTTNRWVCVFRPPREEQNWSHLYCFNSDQRRERLTTVEFGLNYRSRKLLTKLKRVNVKLKRLAKRTIDRATRLGGRSAPCIDLTLPEESFPLLLSQPITSNNSNEVVMPNQPYLFSNIKQNDLCVNAQQSRISQLNTSYDQTSHSFEHSVFGASSFPLISPYKLSAPYVCSDPLRLVNKYEDSGLHFNGFIPPDTIIVDDPLNENQNIPQKRSLMFKEKLLGLGVTVSNICDISDSPDECSSPKLNAKAACNKRERTWTECNNGQSPKRRPGPKSKTMPMIVNTPIYNSPKKVHNSIDYPSSSHCVSLSGNCELSNAPIIEVIELSSDDDDLPMPIDPLTNSCSYLEPKFSSEKENQSSNDRSFARSKNGYSHWWPVEYLPLDRRDSGDSATNGSTSCSVSSQPFSSPYFLLCSNPQLNFLEYKPCGHKFPGLFPIVKMNRFDYDAISHCASSLYTDSSQGKMAFDSIIPRIALDEEVSIKVPLQIDEHTNTCCCSQVKPNEIDTPTGKIYSLSPLMCKAGEIFGKQEALSSIAERTDKNIDEFHYLNLVSSPGCSPLKCKQYDKDDTVISPDDLYFDLSSSHKSLAEESQGFTGQHLDSFRKKKRPEIERLMGDECRELHRRGIGILRQVGGRNTNKITRLSLDKAVPTLKTRRNKFYVVPANHQRSKLRKNSLANKTSIESKVYKKNLVISEVNPKISLKSKADREFCSNFKSVEDDHLYIKYKIDEEVSLKLKIEGDLGLSLKSEIKDSLILQSITENSDTSLKSEVKDETSLKPEIKDEASLKPEIKDEACLKSEIKNETSLKSEIKDDTSLKSEMNENVGCLIKIFDNCSKPPDDANAVDENGNSSVGGNNRLTIFYAPFERSDKGEESTKISQLKFNPSQFYNNPQVSPEKCTSNNDSYIIETGEEFQKSQKKKNKRFRLIRELQNLVGDECKELKELGFNPTDILGTTLLHSPSGSHMDLLDLTDPSDFLTPPTSPNRRPSLLMSDRKYSPNRKKHENDVSDLTFSGQESVKNMMQNNKKLSRELAKLMTDEWKELKTSGSHPSQIPSLLSNQRNLRSIREQLLSQKNNKNKSRCNESKDLTFSTAVNSEILALSRSTRGKARMCAFIELDTPRSMHRSLIQSETGMCVVNYDVPKYEN